MHPNSIVILKELNSELNICQTSTVDQGFFEFLAKNIVWNESFKSRKTASFGIPYNYSGINYEYQPLPAYFESLLDFVFKTHGFFPNNCLVNYYTNERAKMGFHSDEVNNLADGTGIAIFSFGGTRILRLKNKDRKEISVDIRLENGSLFYMSQKVQKYWLHAVLPSNDSSVLGRISVTFRKLSISF